MDSTNCEDLNGLGEACQSGFAEWAEMELIVGLPRCHTQLGFR
jgi:hypothetical protein